MADDAVQREPEAETEPGAGLALGLIVALVTLVVDQLHKLWMFTVADIDTQKLIVVTPFLNLVYVLNKGISYGLFTQDDAMGQYMLAGFAFIVSVWLVVWLWRDQHSRVGTIAIGLIVGGAVANAIDRLHLGGVADFFSLHAFGFYWYVFNIADVAIVVGVLGLLYDFMGLSRKSAAKRS